MEGTEGGEVEIAMVDGVGEVNVETLQLTDPQCKINELDCRSPSTEEEAGLLGASKWAPEEGTEMDGEPIPLKSIPPW